MEKPPKIDLQRNLLPSMSKRYLVKFFFYGALLAGLLIFYWKKSGEQRITPVDDAQQINNVEIEPMPQ
ncbi:MAG: hypothetical protein KJ941_01055 [Bacteroidetes bacterium]|nr:hypothetical protein [Bacteroidota bacterium]